MVYFKLINSFNFDVREKRKAANIQSCFEFGILKFTLSYTLYLDLKNITATNILIIFYFHINGKESDFSSTISQHQGTEFDCFN